GEVVVQFGQEAFLDGLYLHLISDGLAGELLLGVVRRVDDLSLQFLAGLGSAQSVRERFDGGLATDFDEGVLTGDGFRWRLAGRRGFAFGRGFRGRFRRCFDLALVADLGPVTVGQGAIFFNGLNGRARVAQMLDLVLELFFCHFCGGLGDGDVFIAGDREGWQVFEDCLDVQRRAVFNSQLGDLRLADRANTQVVDGLVEACRQNRVDNFFANLSREAAAHDVLRNFAGTEAGNLGVLAVIRGDGLPSLC